MITSIPIPELKARLTDGLPEILFRILTDLKLDGPDRWKGLAPTGDMIAVQAGGHKRGYVFNTTGSGRGDGNLFNLIEELHCNGNRFEACRLCERILGLDPAEWRPDPARAEQVRQTQKEAVEKLEKDRRENFENWHRGYLRGEPQTPESLSGRYLRGRYCPLSPQLRDGRSPYNGSPVMLARMIDPGTLAIKAIHGTKLLERNGRVIKSSARPVKFTPGYPSGCVIPLCHGKSGLSLKEAFHKSLVEPLLIAEGIENALTAHAEFPHLRLFAAGSVGNLANAKLPLRIQRHRSGAGPRKARKPERRRDAQDRD